MPLAEGLDAAMLWRVVPLLVLAWLAFFFGRSLRRGEIPLIERIARVSDPDLPPPLCRYTRRLTIIWTGYFVVAALLSLLLDLPLSWSGALVWLGALALFVGERWCRPLLFPGRSFPDLRQQVLDTASIWRRRS